MDRSPTPHIDTFAIGDVHGCLDQLQALVSVCDAIDEQLSARFIYLGDYIDRGPSSRAVVDFLINFQRRAPDRCFCLLGNHEDMLLQACPEDRSDRDLMRWFGNGGAATLESYGISDPLELPEEHLNWIRSLPLFHQDVHRYFVHAGIRPGIPINKQDRQDLLWIREPFLSSTAEHPKLVVHGHTPTASRKPDLCPNRLNLDVGAVFGGKLIAAAFSASDRMPLYFVDSAGTITPTH